MKRFWGLWLGLALSLGAGPQDRSKKAYELMYEDVQLLKQQFARFEKRLDQTADDFRLLRDQVRDLAAQFKLFQAEQARAQENLRTVPPQVQAIMELLGQIEGQLLRLAEDVQSLKSRPEPGLQPPGGKPEDPPPGGKPASDSAAKPAEKKDTAVPPPPATLNANELYRTSMADFEKGNYDLALDGFKLYREQNSSSPLADDALYYIGECLYSQKKFAPAVEALDELIVSHPGGNRIAVAYLKKGYALAELKKKDEAVAVLKLLVSKFPLEEEAKHAQQKIKELTGKQ
ncbi:MAG: tetratricopeptide repeat protein [Candidatus Aminicenantes bacterium]|nr:tetratricopeptide repeat protein [Candidatus Aminicenantes bacterium]